jgi:hypothetical protein
MSRVFLTDATSVDIDATQAKLDRRSRTPLSSSTGSRPMTAASLFKNIDPYRFALGGFGKDAPKYTIGISRPEDRPIVPTPGPGAYSPPCDALASTKLKHRFPSAHPRSSSAYIDVDFRNTCRFPENRFAYIGARYSKDFYLPIQSPAPNYLPPSSLSPQTHKITSRTPIILPGADSPGSCHYSPQKVSLRRAPAYSVSGVPDRDQWLLNSEGVPGPSDYSPKL